MLLRADEKPLKKDAAYYMLLGALAVIVALYIKEEMTGRKR